MKWKANTYSTVYTGKPVYKKNKLLIEGTFVKMYLKKLLVE